MQFGATFSHRHLRWLKLNPEKAIKEFAGLGLSWIRLGCYWSEIEKKPGEFTFSEIEPLIQLCEKNKINIALTVGMKAPRWPEYYIPDWLEFGPRKLKQIKKGDSALLQATLEFIEKCAEHFKNTKQIRVWQVENEPLDPSGEYWMRISPEFLDEEVKLVRKVDPKRKILVNAWGNEPSKRKTYKNTPQLTDIFGFDFYLRYPPPLFSKFKKYIGPLDSPAKVEGVVREIKDQGKEFWVTEIQAEPWEPEGGVTEKENPPSFLPEHFQNNVEYARRLDPEVTLLWGFEYWLWRKEKRNDERYWKATERVIKK